MGLKGKDIDEEDDYEVSALKNTNPNSISKIILPLLNRNLEIRDPLMNIDQELVDWEIIANSKKNFPPTFSPLYEPEMTANQKIFFNNKFQFDESFK